LCSRERLRLVCRVLGGDGGGSGDGGVRIHGFLPSAESCRQTEAFPNYRRATNRKAHIRRKSGSVGISHFTVSVSTVQ
jgi:hypothetical protein